ncbi:MAG: CoA pyrophosphatase [Actinomycetota bacterium]|nr:CoA pyrophosphatase [Actinomycetota bacterium]
MTAPVWLDRLLAASATVQARELSRFDTPEQGRLSAVLVLFGEGPDGPDLLLIERSAVMRSHAGQPAFPGGAVDPTDDSVVAAALREAQEETGLDPSGVEVLATLPELWLPPSGFIVVPVLAWWAKPSPVAAVDPGEVAAVARVPIAELADPANRLTVRHPSGYVGVAFDVRGMRVWGFTGGLIDKLLQLGGWERPWDRERHSAVPPDVLPSAAS